MKFKENMKRFWTLSRNNGGFTLVELIVVIAILAILGGVAIPAYGAYVTRANRGVDESLAGEIKHAMLIAYYDGTLQPGATVTVFADGTPVAVSADNGAHEAMVNAFGANYAEALALKWDGWKGQMGVAANKELMGAVKDSNFTPNEMDALLGQVQTVVNAAQGALAGTKPGEGSVLAESLNKAGIELDADGTIKESDAGAAANALVFAVADDITKANMNQEEFAMEWANYIGNPDATQFTFEMDSVSRNAVEYAAVLSLAKHIDSKGQGTNFAAQLEGYTGGDILGNKRNVRQAMLDYMDAHPDVATDYNYTNDSKAFLAYMNGVTESSDSLLEKESLYNDKYFTNGTVSKYVKDYVSIGDVLADLDVEDGAFVFYFNGETVSCLPLDY